MRRDTLATPDLNSSLSLASMQTFSYTPHARPRLEAVSGRAGWRTGPRLPPPSRCQSSDAREVTGDQRRPFLSAPSLQLTFSKECCCLRVAFLHVDDFERPPGSGVGRTATSVMRARTLCQVTGVPDIMGVVAPFEDVNSPHVDDDAIVMVICEEPARTGCLGGCPSGSLGTPLDSADAACHERSRGSG